MMAGYIIPTGTINSYFNIDDILASQEKVPCTFLCKVIDLGYIDQSTTDVDIAQDTKLELPIWLAIRLTKGVNNTPISVQTPKHYNEGYRNIYTADPNVVDLHRLGPFFYLFGGKLLSLHLPDGEEIAEILLKTFQGRFRKIMDGSQNALHKDLTSQTNLLDDQERQLFAAGQSSLHSLNRWEKRETEKLLTSSMVSNHRKRKRTIIPNN